MVKRGPSQQIDRAAAKRRNGSGPEIMQRRNGRLSAILEPLVHSATLAERGPLSGQPVSGPSGREALLSRVSLVECACCAFHLLHSRDMRADDIRQRVSPWAWSDVKQLLHRRCVHSLTAQHSKDGERVLLRGFVHVPHDDLEVCSCNGTPNAARVVRTTGAARPAAHPDGASSETGAGAIAAASGAASGCDGSAAAGLAAPGTCGPPDKFTHIVEVIVSTADGSLQSCSSSCCGVGYDALHSQLCPAVAAVLLAARVARGGEVLCEHDLSTLSAAAAGAGNSTGRMATEVPTQPSKMEAVTHGSFSQAGSASAVAADSAGGERDGSCFWTPHDLGFGPIPVARVLAAASGGALVLGPNYVDPPPPLAASILPGPGQPLGLQRELDCPRRVPECVRPHLLPCGRPTAPSGAAATAAAAAGTGPSTSTTCPPPAPEPPPVPPPHVPALPAAEPGSRTNVRYPGSFSSGSFPSGAARLVFGSWYREAAAVVVTTDRYRESYRMLLPPEDEHAPAAAAAANGGGFSPSARRSTGGAAAAGSAPAGAATSKAVKLPPPSWSFGAAGGLVSLELSGSEPAEKYIALKAADRGPVWEARMTFLTSHAAMELDPETRMQSNASESPEPWPPAVLAAFDEACSPVGQPAGANGPAGALCALLRITWLCLHVWDMDAGLSRRAKLVVQAICKLLVMSDLPSYLRAASARILGAWRLKLGDASAHGRRTGYGSTNDVAISDMLSRLTTAYLLARDGWDAPHVLAAMSLDPGPAPSASDRLGAREMGGHLHSQIGFAQPGDAAAPSAAAASHGSTTAGAATAKGPSRPDLQPTWVGFRPANQAAVRRLQQQPQQQQQLGQAGGSNAAAGGNGGGGAAAAAALAGMLVQPIDTNGSSTSTGMSLPFVPYAPPPLQGVATMSTPAMQEVAERLHWLEHFGLDGPYVSMAAVSGEWSKAIKMLLRRGSKSDVERACRLAVERLSSAAAKAQQACFLLHQVLGPPPPAPPQRPGSEASGPDAAPVAMDATAAAGGSGGGSAVAERAATAAADTSGGSGVDSLVVSAVAQLPPTFVAGCAGRMLMSAVRAALSIKTGNDGGGSGGTSGNSAASSNANFEMSFLRASAVSAQNDAASPAAALLAAIKSPAGGGVGITRASPYIALLRSVIAVVAENQEREWRAEEASLRDLGLLDEPANPLVNSEYNNRVGGGGGAAGSSGAPGSKTGKEGCDAGGGGGDGLEEALARLQRASSGLTEYVRSLPTVLRHNAMRAAEIPLRDEHCDCDACRRERRERLALLASEMPPGAVQFVKLRPEDMCFVTDPAAQAAFSKVIPLIPARSSGGSVPRVHSLAVQVVRSVFRPMMALISDPRERPRTVADYVSLLGTVEESMATLCDEVMPERVQLQAVLEGVTVALCALYSCHHMVGASPSALGRVVTDLLSAGQLELARQVAACQLSLSRSADSLAHTLEVAVASGEEVQLEASVELLRLAARDPPLEQRLTEVMAAAMGRTMALAMGGPEIHLGRHVLSPPPYVYSEDYDSDDYSEYFTDDDDDDDDLDDLDPYGGFALSFPYRDMFHADREARRYEEVRQRRHEDRRLQREDRQALRAMLAEAQNVVTEMVAVAARSGNGNQQAARNSQDGHVGAAAAEAAAAAAGGGHGAESDVETEDLLAGVRRHCNDGGGGGRGEEVDGPMAMEIDGKDVVLARGVHAEKYKRDPAHVSGGGMAFDAHAVARHGGGGSGANGKDDDEGGADGSPRMSPRFRRRRRSQSPPHHSGADAATAGAGKSAEGGGGSGGRDGNGGGEDGGAAGGSGSGGGQKGRHELALLLVQCNSQSVSRRLMKVEGDQNLFALAQYIRGRGAGAQLVAPLMAAAVVCLENLKSGQSNSSMQGFTSEMVNASTAPLRHSASADVRGASSSSRLDARGAEGPCLKGLPASSWQAFISARSYRYATDRDESGQVREVMVMMDNHNPIVLTAWVCAAFSCPADLPGRSRVLAAMALAASRRYGPSLAHLGVALARAGLQHMAVAVAARALASTALDYNSFTHGRANVHGAGQPAGQLPWYAACLLELAPVFVGVLGQVMSRQQQQQQQQQQSAPVEVPQGGEAAGAAGIAANVPQQQQQQQQQAGGSGADGDSFPSDAAEAEAEAEAEGRGVGEWWLPCLDVATARTAVANLAVTLLLLRCELPRCLLGCGEAVNAVMALLSKVATKNNIKHEQLFDGGSSGTLGSISCDRPGQSENNLRVWVVAAMRECLLGPLRSAPRDVQQAFVTAVAAMPDNELDFKMKIPLLEWARGARVPVSTIFDAASRAVATATRILENEAAEERNRISMARMEVGAMARLLAPLHLQLIGGGATAAVQGASAHMLAKAASLGLKTQADAAVLIRDLDRALAAASGQCGIDGWIEDKRTPISWGAKQLITRSTTTTTASAAASTAATCGHRSWVWHVLKWVGERLLEEMLTAAATPPSSSSPSAGGSGTGRRGDSASRDTSPMQPPLTVGAGAGAQSTDPRVMLKQLVERTGQFRGPELLPLACTLMDVVAHEGPSSAFVDSARQLLARAVLPEAGRAVSLASNDAWRSAEYRRSLRRILDRWKIEREVSTAAVTVTMLASDSQHVISGRQRRGATAKSGGGYGTVAAGSSSSLTDDLVERVALTLALSEGTVHSLCAASAVLDLTMTVGAGAGATSSPTALPSARGSSRYSSAVAAARTAAVAAAEQLPRLDLRVPIVYDTLAVTMLDFDRRRPGELQPFERGPALSAAGWGGGGTAGGGGRGSNGMGPSARDAITLDLSVQPAAAAAPAPATGGRRGRGGGAAGAAAAAAAATPYRYPDVPNICTVDEDWEDRGQMAAVTMGSAEGWAMEALSLHGALRQVLVVGAIDLPTDDPKAAAVLRFLQVQAGPPSEALVIALAPLGAANAAGGPASATANNNAADGSSGSSGGGGSAIPSEAVASCVSRKYSPRYSVAVWRLVLQLMRRDQGLLAVWRGASSDLDVVHRALQVGTRALAPGTSASRTLTWTHRMDAPCVTVLNALTCKSPHVRCAVAMLRVWLGSRWLLGSCRTPPPAGGLPQLGAAVVAAGGSGDIPLEEKEPTVAMLVDDLIRLNKLSPDLAMDCIRDNPAKYPPPKSHTQQQGQQGRGQGGQPAAAAAAAAAAGGQAANANRSPMLNLAADLVARLGAALRPLHGTGPPAAAGGSGGPGAQGPGGSGGQGTAASATQSPLGGGSALLNSEEVERLNRMEGFVAALGEHVRADPAAKKVLSVLQPRLPPLDDKVLRFLHKNRMHPGGAPREALAAKLVRDFKADELDAMRAAHLPWTPAPGGLKAAKAAELAEWIVEHQAEYLEQQGTAAPHRRRMADMMPYYF